MKLSSNQIRHMLESLPDANKYNGDRYHVLFPIEINTVVNRSAYPDPRMPNKEEWIFNRERHQNGWRWMIDFEADKKSINEFKKDVELLQKAVTFLSERNIALSKEIEETKTKYYWLLSKWYVQTAFNTAQWCKQAVKFLTFNKYLFLSVILSLSIAFCFAKGLHIL